MADQTRQIPADEKKTTAWIVALTIIINAIIVVLFFMPKYQGFDHVDLTFLPMLNAIFNSFTTVFLITALYFIKKKIYACTVVLSLPPLVRLLFFDHLSGLSFVGAFHFLRRRRVDQNHILLHLDHPYRSGRPHRVSGPFHDGSRPEDAGGKAPENRTLDHADLAVCQHHRRAGVFDDFPLLLKKAPLHQTGCFFHCHFFSLISDTNCSITSSSSLAPRSPSVRFRTATASAFISFSPITSM